MSKSFLELYESTKYIFEENHINKNEFIDILWKYDSGIAFDKKESIYKEYKKEIDKIVSGKISYKEALDLLGINNGSDAKEIVSFLKKNLK